MQRRRLFDRPLTGQAPRPRPVLQRNPPAPGQRLFQLSSVNTGALTAQNERLIDPGTGRVHHPKQQRVRQRLGRLTPQHDPNLAPAATNHQLSLQAETGRLLVACRGLVDGQPLLVIIVGNQAIRHSLEIIEQAIGEGASITLAFQKAGFFPPLIIRMLRIGENTGALDEALRNVSYFYNRDVRESVEKTQQLIEPALTLVLGCLLGWIMLSVLGPVYDVITKIGI